MNGNGKRIAALCILLIVGSGWAGLASRSAGRVGQAGTGTETRINSFLSDPNSPPLTGVGLDNGGLFLRMMLAVGIVIGLGAAALYLSRKVLPRVTNAAGREIRIVETTCLGPRKALHLVEVGHQRLLIASTAERITMLAPLGDAQLDVSKQQADDTVEL